MKQARRRRSDVFRAALLVFAVSTCKQADACGKSCNACQSSANEAADDATSCDCKGNPGASGYDDDGWYYPDPDDDGTPQPYCQEGTESCNGPPGDADGCESRLDASITCGHCDHGCNGGACVPEGESVRCEEDVVVEADSSPIIEVESDGVLLAWRTDATTVMRSIPQGTTIDLMTPIADLEIVGGSVFGVTMNGDVVRFVFPETTPQIIAPGPSSASHLRVSGPSSLAWLVDNEIVEANLTSGEIQTIFSGGAVEIVDFAPDGALTWVAGYDGDRPEYWVATASDTEQIDQLEVELGAWPIEVEVDEAYAYLGQGERLFVVDKADIESGVHHVGELRADRDELRVREGWLYTREGPRLLALTPSYVDELVLFDGVDVITSMSVAGDRVFFTADDGILSVPW